ncbi:MULTISPECIES: tautomerase family protein [unclassified Novosphingobium]|uniref:tautomerase family protein n=1 Tax=unclassified Novosphingobium TaxID=2644732 RepID=UPI0013587C10|nr:MULTISPECIES: tautomerase family protein [unclassified Novosphingobium]
MPHIIVKLWPGKSAQQKQALSDAIAQSVMDHLGYSEDAISIGFDEVAPEAWDDQVVKSEILGKWPNLLKQPGYIEWRRDAGARPRRLSRQTAGHDVCCRRDR